MRPVIKQFDRIAAEVAAVTADKDRKYGEAFEKCGEFLRLLYPAGLAPHQYGDALALVRIFDKAMRIATDKDAYEESPYRDLCGYALLGAERHEREKEENNV